ncbi:recQ-mediated genome instability protein 1-like [Anticarsia gemmatalis]|uniref:recQ-mediated genome instability protein 1-like n=1 Tax=Anticarsia gemmatalis TaxID=129554 RepID=UPI003F759AA0
MSSASLINAVRQHLASHQMFVDEEWLVGCVEYLSEDSDSNYTEADIKNLAKEQWLLNDLKSICPGSLPSNLKSQHKTVLNGRFVLQINSAIDIGTPAYQQYLKLQKVNMENVEATTNYEEKISSHRMIKLELTDGVQEISGIEYRPMRNLSCDITPGCKVLIKGPVECRRGMLLLTESAVELLGGEVQEIAISNSLAGLLTAKLGVTITPGADLNTTINQPRNANIPTPHTDMPPTTNHTHEPILEPARHIQQNFADDDIDIDQLAALEAQFTDNPGKRSLTTEHSNPEKKQKTVNNVDDYPTDNDLLFDEDDDYLRELEAQIDAQENEPMAVENKGPVRVSAEPFVYIKQLNEMSEIDRYGKVFNVKGQVMTLLSKLSVGKGEWSLKCTIVDGTGKLDVEFASDVLSKLVGVTPQQMNLMKKQMASKPELQEKVVSAIKNARDQLQVMCCIIEITMLEVPKITDYRPFDSSHVELLKRRAHNNS